MPEMDGTQTLANLRKNPATERIPVIFLTVKGKFEEFDNLKELGALAVLTKPFDPTTLTEQITNILKSNPMPEPRARSSD
jgi:CheY-like chemotaxis protein